MSKGDLVIFYDKTKDDHDPWGSAYTMGPPYENKLGLNSLEPWGKLNNVVSDNRKIFFDILDKVHQNGSKTWLYSNPRLHFWRMQDLLDSPATFVFKTVVS